MSGPSNTARNLGTRAPRYSKSRPSPSRDESALRVCRRSVMDLPATIPGVKSVNSQPATRIRRPGCAAARGAAAEAAATSRAVSLLLGVLEESRGEPDLESEGERDLGDVGEPLDVAANYPHCVGVQVVPDDLELVSAPLPCPVLSGGSRWRSPGRGTPCRCRNELLCAS